MNNLIKNADYENIKEQLREKAGVLMEELKYNRDRDWWLRTIKNE